MNSNQFSEHGFVIRERKPFEVSDLAFLVLRKVWRPLLFYFCLLFIPCFILTQSAFTMFIWSFWTKPFAPDISIRYFGSCFYYIAVLYLTIGYISSFVTSFMTIWLGEWFFHPEIQIPVRKVLSTWFRLLPQILFYQVLFRFYYIFRYYTAEILLLEKTSFFSKPGMIGTSKRIRIFQKTGGSIKTDMHSYNNFFALVYIVGGFFFFYSWFCNFYVGNDSVYRASFYLLWFYPLYCWIFVFYLAVYNFLGYLHIRIEREGWDLEIAFKSEYLHYEEETDGFVPLSAQDLYVEREDTVSLVRPDLKESNVRSSSQSTITEES